MEVNFNRNFTIELHMSESELSDLLLDLDNLHRDKTELLSFRSNLKMAIENSKGMIQVKTE